jgi:hypothetical protein
VYSDVWGGGFKFFSRLKLSEREFSVPREGRNACQRRFRENGWMLALSTSSSRVKDFFGMVGRSGRQHEEPGKFSVTLHSHPARYITPSLTAQSQSC